MRRGHRFVQSSWKAIKAARAPRGGQRSGSALCGAPIESSGTERLTMRLFPRRISKQSAEPRPGAGKKSRHPLRLAGIAALIVLGLILVSTAGNLFLEGAEKTSISAYGERIAISSG